MALLLLLETSANNCSAALSCDQEVLYAEMDTVGMSHSVRLGTFVDKALQVAEQKGLKIQAVAVSSGPGSYTGLRIGVSMAKGICYAMSIPFIAVPTLDLLADELSRMHICSPDALIRPLIDARRMEVYTALYDAKGNQLKPAEAVVVDAHTFDAEMNQAPVWFIGDGSKKCQPHIVSNNAFFKNDITPNALSMISLAENRFRNNQFENVAYFEPFYLKDFVATISKKNLIPNLKQ